MTTSRDEILANVTDMLRAVLNDPDADIDIAWESALFDDLNLNSVDLITVAGRIRARYGKAVSFARFVAEVDATAGRQLSVGQLVEFIASSLDRSNADPGGRAQDPDGEVTVSTR